MLIRHSKYSAILSKIQYW